MSKEKEEENARLEPLKIQLSNGEITSKEYDEKRAEILQDIHIKYKKKDSEHWFYRF